jgi:hypothetical protein
MNEAQQKKLADYIVTYLDEEKERGNTEDTSWLIWNAINAFFGGAR